MKVREYMCKIPEWPWTCVLDEEQDPTSTWKTILFVVTHIENICLAKAPSALFMPGGPSEDSTRGSKHCNLQPYVDAVLDCLISEDVYSDVADPAVGPCALRWSVRPTAEVPSVLGLGPVPTDDKGESTAPGVLGVSLQVTAERDGSLSLVARAKGSPLHRVLEEVSSLEDSCPVVRVDQCPLPIVPEEEKPIASQPSGKEPPCPPQAPMEVAVKKAKATVPERSVSPCAPTQEVPGLGSNAPEFSLRKWTAPEVPGAGPDTTKVGTDSVPEDLLDTVNHRSGKVSTLYPLPGETETLLKEKRHIRQVVDRGKGLGRLACCFQGVDDQVKTGLKDTVLFLPPGGGSSTEPVTVTPECALQENFLGEAHGRKSEVPPPDQLGAPHKWSQLASGIMGCDVTCVGEVKADLLSVRGIPCHLSACEIVPCYVVPQARALAPTLHMRLGGVEYPLHMKQRNRAISIIPFCRPKYFLL
ncbi:hypothetical protein FKM82_005789 [Ascaphus truei]